MEDKFAALIYDQLFKGKYLKYIDDSWDKVNNNAVKGTPWEKVEVSDNDLYKIEGIMYKGRDKHRKTFVQ